MRRTPSPRRRGRPWQRAGLATLVVLLAACSGEQTTLEPAGYYAQQPHNLFILVMWIALAVFILVQGLVIFTSWRFREKQDDDRVPKQVHGNTRLEIFWTVVPALVLAGIAIPTVRMVFDLNDTPEEAMVIEVIGHRWWWEYRYPDSGIITANELVIPVETDIHLELRSEEQGLPDRGVIHSFWIPALAGKQDVFPGRVMPLNMRADEVGRYLGQCAEYCGLSHGNMRNRGIVLSQADFEQWVRDQQAPAVVPDGSDPLVVQGQELFAANCAACHSIRSEPVASADDFVSTTGPNLTHLMSRHEFAGAIFDLYERVDDDPNAAFTDIPNVEQIRAWISNAPGEKPMRSVEGIGMPSFASLPDDQIDALVAYVLSLE